MGFARRVGGFAAAGIVATLVSCGGGGGGGSAPAAPSITSFTASSPFVAAGSTVDLTGVFTGRYAYVVPGSSTATSGVPVTVSPVSDTTYTLVVVGFDGTVATADVAVSVVDFTFDVTSVADSGPGTLREAMETSSAAPLLRTAVTFSVTTPATITLASDLPSVVGTLYLVGPGTPADLAIDGAGTNRILFVDGGRAVLSDVTLQNGRAQGAVGGPPASPQGGGGGGGAAGMGGGAFVNGGVLSCTRVRFTGNGAQGGTGGGVFTPGLPGGGGGGGGGVRTSGAGGAPGTGGAGGGGGPFGGAGGAGSTVSGTAGQAGGAGAGGGGGLGSTGGAGGFGGGGGGGTNVFAPGTGGAGGFGGGGGGGASGAAGGTHGGAGASDPFSGGGGGGAGLGGAVFVRLGALLLVDCAFDANTAAGGAGGAGNAGGAVGLGKGGAIYLMPAAFATQTGTTFTSNVANNDAAIPGDDDDVFGTFD